MAVKEFDPNATSINKNNLYGLPGSPEAAALIIIPIPWEVTVSYRGGTSKGPARVLEASHQIDLYDSLHLELWKKGISLDQFPFELEKKGYELQKLVKRSSLQNEGNIDNRVLTEVNQGSEQLNDWVKNRVLSWLEKGKLVGTLGGDHSTCFGLISAVSEMHEEFSILQIDAHADLRSTYQGFKHSHASIMHNALQIPQVNKLVCVGIRDYCEEEARIIQDQDRIICFNDQKIKRTMFEGKTWKSIADVIVDHLGQQVYLSFDVDGLNPVLCPKTGTRVPGGLEYEQAVYLIETLVDSGREIIGFDISETGDGEWDGNVSARILWRIAGLALR